MFYDRIKQLCEQRGISPYKACTDIGLNRSAVAKWKNGSTPNGTTAAKLAEYFSVPVDCLIGAGYGGGVGSGAGYGDGSGYGGPVLEGSTAYDRTVELCSIYAVNSKGFPEICAAVGLDDHAVDAWKRGVVPNLEVLRKIAEMLLVPIELLLGEDNNKTPTESGERDILDEVDLAFYGNYKELSEANKETLRAMARVLLEQENKG